MRKTGRLFVLSAPSGSGKTTVLDALLRSERNAVRSISATTRAPRRGERQGRDYLFLSPQRFLRTRVGRGFLESARILGHWYGTPRAPIERALRVGRSVFLGIDIQGARSVRRSGLPVTTIFLLPPSWKVLGERLRRRGTETSEQIRQRLRLARREMREVEKYDYAVVNRRLQDAVAAIRTIVRAEQHRVKAGRGQAR